MQGLLFALSGFLALASANPFLDHRNTCKPDSCASAVTGNSAGLPLAVRQADCSAFLSPSPTPTVPSYASACNPSKYSSACACLDYAAPTDTCITPAKATWIVDTFASLLTAPQAPDFSSKANALLASTFTDTSGSINFLANKNISAVTFPNKEAFIVGQGSQPPIPVLKTLDIFFTCTKIAWRWVAQGIGSGQYEVKGIDTFTITPGGQISEAYAEFNSGAWLADIGNRQCPKGSKA
ncbi:hypothetical protein RBB50_008338 [Rhinocladiella similis]